MGWKWAKASLKAKSLGLNPANANKSSYLQPP